LELILNQLNAKEINKLKSFLRTIQDGATSCSLAQGKSLYFGYFLASKTDKNNRWILDSGAIDHMTPNLHVFETYEPLEITKQITIAIGTSVPIIGQGKVNLSPCLSIDRVLHVPNLAINLISIH